MSPSGYEFDCVAEAIGTKIVRDAFWHENRCNWLGAQPIQRLGRDGGNGMAYQTLGPDLYSGTSGVALFLAELAAITGDSATRNTAMAAIRQALSRSEDVPPAARLGLFSGWLGIVLAAVRISIILDSPEIRSEALLLLQRCRCERIDTAEFDLMAGNAGAISALLVLEHMLQDSALLDFAARLGAELVNRAEKNGSGWSWESPGWTNHRNLTGFSHGTAGCGLAFLELFHATGQPEFYEAGGNAFHYERAWFDPVARNWPDFRKNPSSGRRKKTQPPCLSFWCHGAPGIAMARLRTCEILNGNAYREEATIAVETTASSIEAAIDEWTGNFSMCHGLAGNGEVLLYAVQILGSEHYGETLLSRVAHHGIERFVEGKAPWPCGTHSGETPNLMLGLSGIGQFYLRMGRRSIPSVLVLRKEMWGPRP
jgi:lantibiotic biosynthesis protein